MHNPLVSPLDRPTATLATVDAPIVCPVCLDTLAPNGTCLNIGACYAADRAATRDAARTTLKAPLAFTIGGNVD
jgi:hypothetical protein